MACCITKRNGYGIKARCSATNVRKGRYRQFHQVGAETYGFDGPDIDAEVILLSARPWQELGLLEHVTPELNSLGSASARGLPR